jgi:PAS domain S-box-containing protein
VVRMRVLPSSSGLSVIFRDISSAVETEEQLRRTQERLDAALSAGEVGTWVWDIPADRLIADRNLARLFSIPEEQVEEASMQTFIERIHPDDRERVERTLNESMQENQSHFRTEYRVLQPDGTSCWLIARVTYERDDAGRPLRMSGVVLDITERKRAEEALRDSEARLRELADAMPQIIWVTRPDGYHEHYNRKWYEYIGLDYEHSKGNQWANPLHPDDQERSRQRWEQALQTGEPYEIEYRFRRHDGVYHWFLGRALPVRDSNGQIVRWYGTCTDIEDMKRLQEERQQLLESERAARTEFERANRLKDEFLATVSHELRTPLQSILGWAGILRRNRSSEPELAKAADIIERNARLQAQLVADLLDVSRIISGKLRLELAEVDLGNVIRAAAESVATAAAAKQIRLEIDGDDEVIRGDPARLQQVIWNLMANAIKFTPQGGRVRTQVTRTSDRVEIAVADTGQGIDPEFVPHVFDRFRQADASTTRRHGGLGLGLAIVRHIVEMHGGTVRAESPGVGQGATFVASLPAKADVPQVAETAAADEARLATFEAPPVLREACLEGLKVLVVDDEPDACELIRRVLTEFRADVVTAPSARQALEILHSEHQPDVLLSDIGMPDEDGYQFIRRVRELPADKGGRIPAAAVTAFARPEDRDKVIAAGFDAYLAKPVESVELVSTVLSLAGNTTPDGNCTLGQ